MTTDQKAAADETDSKPVLKVLYYDRCGQGVVRAKKNAEAVEGANQSDLEFEITMVTRPHPFAQEGNMEKILE